MSRLTRHLPRPTHPAVVAATVVLVALAVAAVELLHRATWFAPCAVDGSGRDGTDCFAEPPITDDQPAKAIGWLPLAAVVAIAGAWLVVYACLLVARWRRARRA